MLFNFCLFNKTTLCVVKHFDPGSQEVSKDLCQSQRSDFSTIFGSVSSSYQIKKTKKQNIDVLMPHDAWDRHRPLET